MFYNLDSYNTGILYLFNELFLVNFFHLLRNKCNYVLRALRFHFDDARSYITRCTVDTGGFKQSFFFFIWRIGRIAHEVGLSLKNARKQMGKYQNSHEEVQRLVRNSELKFVSTIGFEVNYFNRSAERTKKITWKRN